MPRMPRPPETPCLSLSSKRKQDVQRQPAERCTGVELLGDRNEAHFVLLEHAQHPREVEQRPAQTVDLVHHDAIEVACLDRSHTAGSWRSIGVVIYKLIRLDVP